MIVISQYGEKNVKRAKKRIVESFDLTGNVNNTPQFVERSGSRALSPFCFFRCMPREVLIVYSTDSAERLETSYITFTSHQHLSSFQEPPAGLKHNAQLSHPSPPEQSRFDKPGTTAWGQETGRQSQVHKFNAKFIGMEGRLDVFGRRMSETADFATRSHEGTLDKMDTKLNVTSIRGRTERC
ncbi:hypothetical protein BC629DRAFT_1443495 [Irpex lacteus]|nr:hypothetical protein BC629DRAFT_1443495 [Irpex lacteus]